MFREHFQPVARAVRRFGVPARYQEDVAQEVFVAVLRSLPRYDPSRPFKPWLHTITYRTARDFLRSHRHHLEELVTQELDLKDSAPSVEERRVRRDAEAIFQRIVGTLDEELRQVFLMHEVDEISVLDIATAMRVPASTVTSRLRRARKEFDAAVRRLRAAEEFRTSGALFIPITLIDPEHLLAAGRGLPEVPDEMQARVWEHVRRANSGGSIGALSRLAALTPRQIATAMGAALTFGAALGGGAGIVFSRPASSRADAPERVEVSAEVHARTADNAARGTAAPSGSAIVPSPASLASSAANGGIRVAAAARAGIRVAAAARAGREERALLDHARRALAGGQVDAAVRDLGTLAEQFPESANPAERAELRRAVLQQVAARPSTE